MPSEKVLEQKKQIVADLAETLKNSVAGVVVDYKGITVKNTLLGLAAKDAGIDGLDDVLNGTTAVATSAEDYVAAARILSKFSDGHKTFAVKSGFLDGKVIDLEMIKSLAKLPSREILLATVCNVFNAPIASFARAVQAIVDKQNEGAAPAEAEGPELHWWYHWARQW